MIRRFLPFVVAAFLGACATAPTYQPAVSAEAPGYSETQVESNRYFVTYRASGAEDASVLSDYALLRAAEVTLQHNRDWFWVDRRTLDSQRGRSGPSFGLSLGGASFGGHTSTGVGLGVNIPIGRPQGNASAATLEIRFGEGPKPDDANAYDAHSISTNLRSRLMLH